MNALNENELEVLRILWEKSPRKPADIQNEFGWPIDNGTLRSVLIGMIDGNLLKRERDGRAFFYALAFAKRRNSSRLPGDWPMFSQVARRAN